MTDIYLNLFLIICFGLLVWGLIKPERVYQYPFFMGGIFISFLSPQAIALYNNPKGLSTESIEKVLLVSSLCAAMCWIGYQWKPQTSILKRLSRPIDENKLLPIGIGMSIFGTFFNYLITITPVQTGANGNWTGPLTIYAFFGSTSLIALTILMIALLRSPDIGKIILICITATPLMLAIFASGRRQTTATVLIIIGLVLFYKRKLIPPRWLIVTILILTLFLIPILANFRGSFWVLLFQGQVSITFFQENLTDLLKGDILELRNAALFIDAADKTNQYGLGTGFWNGLVFQFIPGQILGQEFKSSFYINLTNYNLIELFGYYIPSGSTTTGVGDSFIEFGYFGCIIFAIISYMFKHLWISAVYMKSIYSQILYAGLVSPALVGLTHGITRFIQELIFQLIFVGIVAYFGRKKRSQKDINYLTEV